MLARWAAALAGVPAVFTPHGWAISDRISPRQGRIFKIFERAAGRISARIINVCEYERLLAVQHRIAPDAKLAVVHNGICDVPNHLWACPEIQPPKLITVARFEEPKDFGTLFAALAQLKNEAWTIDLAGDGPLQAAMRRSAAELGILERLRFLGARNDVDSLLAQAQVFVLSTRSEAFPYTILEAMRAGLPIVSSNVGGISEAAENGKTGFLFTAKNVSQLRDALHRLILDPQLRKTMGAAGRRRFSEHFTIDKMVNQTLQIYREVIAERSAERRAATSRSNRHLEIAGYGNKQG
jgi:glycosyltransferase involved in cell wall biosynthesis